MTKEKILKRVNAFLHMNPGQPEMTSSHRAWSSMSYELRNYWLKASKIGHAEGTETRAWTQLPPFVRKSLMLTWHGSKGRRQAMQWLVRKLVKAKCMPRTNPEKAVSCEVCGKTGQAAKACMFEKACSCWRGIPCGKKLPRGLENMTANDAKAHVRQIMAGTCANCGHGHDGDVCDDCPCRIFVRKNPLSRRTAHRMAAKAVGWSLDAAQRRGWIKNPPTRIAKGYGYWDTTYYPYGGSFHRFGSEIDVIVIGYDKKKGVNFKFNDPRDNYKVHEGWTTPDAFLNR